MRWLLAESYQLGADTQEATSWDRGNNGSGRWKIMMPRKDEGQTRWGQHGGAEERPLCDLTRDGMQRRAYLEGRAALANAEREAWRISGLLQAAAIQQHTPQGKKNETSSAWTILNSLAFANLGLRK